MLLRGRRKPGHDTPTVEDMREFLLAAGMPIQKTPERVVAVDVAADDRNRQGPQTRVAQRHRTTPQAEAAQSSEVAGAP